MMTIAPLAAHHQPAGCSFHAANKSARHCCNHHQPSFSFTGAPFHLCRRTHFSLFHRRSFQASS
jgi:hypothetical protein